MVYFEQAMLLLSLSSLSKSELGSESESREKVTHQVRTKS